MTTNKQRRIEKEKRQMTTTDIIIALLTFIGCLIAMYIGWNMGKGKL